MTGCESPIAKGYRWLAAGQTSARSSLSYPGSSPPLSTLKPSQIVLGATDENHRNVTSFRLCGSGCG
jgi:hypothetical protein